MAVGPLCPIRAAPLAALAPPAPIATRHELRVVRFRVVQDLGTVNHAAAAIGNDRHVHRPRLP